MCVYPVLLKFLDWQVLSSHFWIRFISYRNSVSRKSADEMLMLDFVLNCPMSTCLWRQSGKYEEIREGDLSGRLHTVIGQSYV